MGERGSVEILTLFFFSFWTKCVQRAVKADAWFLCAVLPVAGVSSPAVGSVCLTNKSAYTPGIAGTAVACSEEFYHNLDTMSFLYVAFPSADTSVLSFLNQTKYTLKILYYTRGKRGTIAECLA